MYMLYLNHEIFNIFIGFGPDFTRKGWQGQAF